MANDTAELIIEFRRGVDEASAKAVAASIGGSVRRRMRTDHSDQVMLLVRVPADNVQRLAQQATSHPHVSRVEVNQGGFGIR